MTEIFVEELGVVWVNDSIAKFDLYTSTPSATGKMDRTQACRIVIPLSKSEEIVGRLYKFLISHLENGAAAGLPTVESDGDTGVTKTDVEEQDPAVVVAIISKSRS